MNDCVTLQPLINSESSLSTHCSGGIAALLDVATDMPVFIEIQVADKKNYDFNEINLGIPVERRLFSRF